jgi:hypothetical protein
LLFVLVVLVIFISGAKPPGTKATAYTFLKSVIECLIGYTILLISPIKPVADLGQLFVLGAILGHKVYRYAVVAILIDDTNDAEVNLIDLEAWFVLELVA